MAKHSPTNGKGNAKSSPEKKAPVKPNAKNKKGAPRATAGGKGEVVIRMYRQGLGDCFLLAFPPVSGTKPVYVLIDCGVLQKTLREPEKMRSVVAHIEKTTGGEHDPPILNPQHLHHLAGLSHPPDRFHTYKIRP